MKVALVMPDDFSLWQPRRGLIAALVRAGFQVDAISTPGPYVDRLEALGARHIPVEMDRMLDPRADLAYFTTLFRIFRAGKYQIVHNLTTKPNIYGTIAARLAGVPQIAISVEGLGQAFGEGTGLRGRAARAGATALYWTACRLANRVRFMNPDDLEFFASRGLVPRDKIVLIRGEGVNLAEYDLRLLDSERIARLRADFCRNGAKTLVVMVARAIWPKGVKEFVEAAEIVRARDNSATFLHVGGTDVGPDAVPAEYLKSKESSGFRWVGFWDDLREIFAVADMIVLPSYLREGVPGALIEAMALGQPIITTDNVGCREAVEHGRNGFLVPPRDSAALAEAITRLVEDRELRERFGRESRRMVETEFDERRVFQRVVRELYDLPDLAG